LSSRLGNKLRQIERAAGGRRFTREQLTSHEAQRAFDFLSVIEAEVPGVDVSPERRALARSDCDRVIRADVALASGNAAGLAPAYREVIAEWKGRLDRLSRSVLMQALAAEGLADWDSAKRDWVGPGEGDPTGESEFVTERRWRRALEAVREWTAEQIASKAFSAADLTEQKRRESDSDSKWADLTQALEALRAEMEPDDEE